MRVIFLKFRNDGAFAENRAVKIWHSHVAFAPNVNCDAFFVTNRRTGCHFGVRRNKADDPESAEPFFSLRRGGTPDI